MLEVVGRIVAHAEPLHHSPGRRVEVRRERHDLLQAELIEAVAERRPARLGRIAVAPMLAPQPPADLDGGSEVLLEARPCEPHEADEARAPHNLDRPQPPALVLDLPAGTLREN